MMSMSLQSSRTDGIKTVSLGLDQVFLLALPKKLLLRQPLVDHFLVHLSQKLPHHFRLVVLQSKKRNPQQLRRSRLVVVMHLNQLVALEINPLDRSLLRKLKKNNHLSISRHQNQQNKLLAFLLVHHKMRHLVVDHYLEQLLNKIKPQHHHSILVHRIMHHNRVRQACSHHQNR